MHTLHPLHRYDQYSDAWDTSVVINVDGEPVRFFHSVKKGVHRVWIDHPWFLAKVRRPRVWGRTAVVRPLPILLSLLRGSRAPYLPSASVC